MPTLSELKQNANKDSGIIDKPEDLKVLSKDDLRKIMPEKKEENTAAELLNKEVSEIDNIIDLQMKEVEDQKEKSFKENQDIFNDAIFDAPIEDMDTGVMSEEEIDTELKTAFKNAVSDIKEDPSVKAGIDAVNSIGEDVPSKESMDDLLNDLNNDELFDEDDEEYDVSNLDDEDDDDIDEEENQKEMLKSLQEQVQTTIKPFDNIIDLKGFTIATKPQAAADVLKQADEGPTATWVLLDTNTSFTCSALGAVEIENLDPNKTNAQNGRITALKQMYGTLYKHYTSPNKPGTLEEWLKTISFADQDNLIFGYYKSTFGLSNLLTYACDKCNEVKIEEVPIDKCIKYKDKETEEEVKNILNFGDPTYKPIIKSKLVQVSDKYAVSIKSPSIYNIVFEFGVLDADFTNKFADVLGVVGYIEDMFKIDVVNKELIPIRVKEDKKNLTKSVKRRIRAKTQLLSLLTPDQYNILLSEISEFGKNANKITYCQPEYKCKKCNNVIDETEMSAQSMLFTRHQLALIKNLSIE